MSSPHATPKITAQLTAVSPDYITMLTTPWMLNFGPTSAGFRVFSEHRGRTGTFRSKVAWRVADVMPDFPGPWTLSEYVRQTDGEFVEDFTTTSDAMWVQGGLAVSAADIGECLVSLQAAVKGTGAVLAAETVELNPDLNSAATAYFPIGEPFQHLQLTSLDFAFIIMAVNGELTYRPAVRYMKRPDQPDDWIDLGSPATVDTQNAQAVSGALSVTPTSGTLLAQAGLKITAMSNARVAALVAGRF